MPLSDTASPESAAALPSRRAGALRALADHPVFDLLVIGGGATGLGVALDAVTRGLTVALVEASDFAKGTSSRATKLVHGGVRYLAQGNISLVREALRERAILLANAPHLAQPLPFVMPSYRLWEAPFYGAGLRMYDALAGKSGLGATQFLSSAKVRKLLPNVAEQGLRGGVQYWDGQFDDARLALALARTAVLHGAHVLNYCKAEQLLMENGRVGGATVVDSETQARFDVRARCVVNATGVWVDALRQQAVAAAQPLVVPSQGAHVVVDRHFWPSQHALLVPKTADGRVLFAVPWLGQVILGTTDSPRADMPLEPRPQAQEIGFILKEAANYLATAPSESNVRSTWAGLRPLVRPAAQAAQSKAISREHTIEVSVAGLVTVTGGKWTTYRAMAEDVIRQCQLNQLLPVKLRACETARLPLVGSPAPGSEQLGAPMHEARGLAAYGLEAVQVQALPGADVVLDAQHQLTEAMVRFAARHEWARNVEDVLARRSRLLFLDAAAALRLAPRVAALLREELGAQTDVQQGVFEALAASYQLR